MLQTLQRVLRATSWLALASFAGLGAADTGSAQQGCIQDTSPTGTGVRQFPADRCGGLDYTVSIPERCPASGCGLIVDTHGFVMDASIQDRNTDLRRLGRQNGFVVVQPTARVDETLGLTSFDGSADTDRVRAFVEQLVDAADLDRSKIHVGGFSQGGAQAFDFVCRHSDLIASAAPIAASSVDCFGEGLPVPVLQTNGLQDTIAEFPRAAGTRDAILRGMGLTLADGIEIDSGSGITQTRFTTARGEVYEFIQHDFTGASAGDGHCFPGSFEEAEERVVNGPGVGGLRFACEDDATIRIGEAQIQFYIQNPKLR